MQKIYVFKGDSTVFATKDKFITFNIETDLDLTGWKAVFTLDKVRKIFYNIESKSFEVILTCNDTSTLTVGNINGELKLIDNNNNIKTIANTIPFFVTTEVEDYSKETINLNIPDSPDVKISVTMAGSGGEGVTNYELLNNKPLINDVTLIGNKTATDLGLISTEEFSSALDTKQDVGDYVTNSSLLEKQYITIDDIPSDISYFNNDSGYITEESDPTVPSWAKQPEKPSYTASEVGALPSDTIIPDITNLATKEELQSGLDAKQNVGDYATKAEIPTNISQLTNDSNFITNAVDNLTNYTKTSDLSTVTTSGSYEDLSNKPQINNIVLTGNITVEQLDLVTNEKLEAGLSLKQPVGDYVTSDELNPLLEQKANISDIPSKISQLTNDSNFITNNADDLVNYTKSSDLSTVATTGSYNDLENKPTIPSEYVLPKASTSILGGVKIDGTTISINEEGIISSINSSTGTTNYESLSNKPQINSIDLIGNKSLEELGIQPAGNYITQESDPTVPSWAKQPQKPTYTAEEVGALSSDTVIPDISNLATSQELEEGLATKQDKGDYAIKSEIPTNTSDLTNDSNFITNSVDNLVNYTKSSDLSTVATSGSYNDLENKPSIPDISGLATKDELNLKADKTSIPTNVSQLANDSGFITSIPQEYITETELESKGYLTSIPDTVQLKSDSSLNTSNKTVSGAINEINTELSNKANSSDIPSSISELTNDSGFITNSVDNLLNYTKTSDLSTVATSGSYNDLQDKPVIPVVPANILLKPTESVLEETNVTISVLNSNYKYICSNPITSLNITALDSTKCEIETTIIFTTGDTISVSIPEDIKIIGDYNFEPNKNYIICFWENNLVSAEAKSQA